MTDTSEWSATPRLRFPEFRDSGAWKVERMGKLYSFLPTNTYSRDKLTYEYGTVKSIHYGDIHTQFPTLVDVAKERIPFIIASEAVPEHGSGVYCREGDIIFADASEDLNDVGKSIEIVRLNGELVVSGQHTILARRNGDVPTVGFGGLLSRSSWIRSQIQKEAQGTKVYGISPRRLANVELAYPVHVEEQRKIADCLTSLDDVIAAEAQKVKALNVHKQGLMQQLFPREGETVPRVRFPEFRDAPEWKETRAGSLFANRTERSEANLPLYSVTMHDGMVRRSSFDRDFGDIEDPAGNKMVRRGDIAYNMMRMWQGALGVAEEDCLVSPAYIVLSPKANVVSDFFAYVFKLPNTLLLLTSHSRGLTKDRLRLYYGDFAQITLRSPDPAEQQRIADCLASIDADIGAALDKLKTLKNHKTGLMQRLFPVVIA